MFEHDKKTKAVLFDKDGQPFAGKDAEVPFMQMPGRAGIAEMGHAEKEFAIRFQDAMHLLDGPLIVVDMFEKMLGEDLLCRVVLKRPGKD
jgi:hypothetical protein